MRAEFSVLTTEREKKKDQFLSPQQHGHHKVGSRCLWPPEHSPRVGSRLEKTQPPGNSRKSSVSHSFYGRAAMLTSSAFSVNLTPFTSAIFFSSLLSPVLSFLFIHPNSLNSTGLCQYYCFTTAGMREKNRMVDKP